MHCRALYSIVCGVLLLLLSACSTTKYVPEGSYLLNKVSIRSDVPNLKNSEAMSYLRQRPNPKLLELIPFNLWTYDLSGRDTTRWINRFLRKIGDGPVIYSEEATQASEQELLKMLHNKGYEQAIVSSEVKFKKKKAAVTYTLLGGQPYRIRQLKYRVKQADVAQIVLPDTVHKVIHSGDLFDVDQLEKERQRITRCLRDSGYYYFGKEFIGYVADSSLKSHQVDLRVVVRPMQKLVGKDTFKSLPHPRYQIEKVNYYAVENATDVLNDSVLRSLTHESYNELDFYYSRHFIRASTLYNHTYIMPGDLYSDADVDRTYASLSDLHVFKYLNISFRETSDSTAVDSLGIHSLECNIVLCPDKNQNFSLSVEGINNEGDFGIAGKITYNHRNIFHGGESLKFNVRGADESVIGLRSIWEISGEASLTFPHILLPGIKRKFIKSNTAETDVYVNISYQIRTDYQRTIAGTGMRYRWTAPNKINHQVDFVDFNYVYLPYMSEAMKQSISQSLLKYSYEDHLIMSTGYNISYSNQHLHKNSSNFSIRGAVETGGNLLYGICAAVNASKNESGSYLVGHIPFAQYVKVDGDFAFNQYITTRHSLAYHIGIGVGVPYGNSSILPFEKRYYGGGANSVRGWSARSLGPGAYNADGNIDYMKQSGDISLNMNIEYRSKLVWVLEFAAFVDAGNIWTLADEGQAGGQFKWNQFYEQIALAYGIGLRMNFDFFVVRLDWGIKAFNPANYDHPWRFDSSWNIVQDTALHLAVGYPF